MEIFLEESNYLREVGGEKISYSCKLAVDETIDGLEINKTNIGLLYPGQDERVNEILRLNMERGREFTGPLIKDRLYKYVEKALENFTKNEAIVEFFQEGEDFYSEMPFTFGLTRKNKEVFHKVLKLLGKSQAEEVLSHDKEIIINGVIDLVIKSRDGSWTILDYKTDRPLYNGLNLPAA